MQFVRPYFRLFYSSSSYDIRYIHKKMQSWILIILNWIILPLYISFVHILTLFLPIKLVYL